MRAHLIADVPVGLFLSSGLDSSAIAAFAARAQSGIQSFTLSFPDTPYDEAPLAAVVAKHTGTKHKEIPLRGADMLARLEEALSALDQPTMDGINTYFVSWAAREVGLKVALSGTGRRRIVCGVSQRSPIPKDWRDWNWRHGLFPARSGASSAPLINTLLRQGSSADGARKASDAWLMPDALPHPVFFHAAVVSAVGT